MADINKTLPSNTYNELIAPLSQQHANILFQLRINDVSRQTYLQWIGKAPTATCPTCHTAPETVAHFLLVCPTYPLHNVVHFCPPGYSGHTLTSHLNSADSIHPLFGYINATGQFRSVFGPLNAPLLGDNDSA